MALPFHFKYFVVNKNPRNLEMVGLAYKPLGWPLQYPSRDFYNRIVFRTSGRFLYADLLHHTGKVVMSASTKEHCIRRHLASASNRFASQMLGRVIADRVVRCGIERCSFALNDAPSDREKSFYEGLKQEPRLSLQEPDFIYAPYFNHGVDYDMPQQQTEQAAIDLSKPFRPVFPNQTGNKSIEERESEFIWGRIQHHWKHHGRKYRKADEEEPTQSR